MKLTPVILPIVCCLAFSACSESTRNSNTSSAKAEPAAKVASTETKWEAAPATTPSAPIAAVVEAPAPVVEAPVVEAPVVEAPAPAVVEAPKAPVYDFPSHAPRNLQRRFIEKDVNKDGFLTLEEFTTYLAVWLAENQPGKDPVRIAPMPFGNKDVNGDGLLSPQEAF